METERVKRSTSLNFAGVALMALGILGLAAGAGATVILPGQSLPTTGSGGFIGVSDSSALTNPFTGTDIFSNVVFSGTMLSQVFTDSNTGKLDFIYHFSNDSSSTDAIQRLSVAGFAGFSVDADYIPATGAAFPTTVNRDSSGGIVGFTFSAAAPVLPGQDTDDLVIKTDATQYTIGNASLQDGGNGNVSVYVPVPEPASAAIAALGLSALALRRRKRSA
jgi:PEP-CTERM motif